MPKGKTKKANKKDKPTSKKQSKSKPAPTVTKALTVEPTQPTQPQPIVVVEPIAQPATPVPAAIMMLPSKNTIKVVAQIGRYVVHQARNVADEYTITDTLTRKPIANVHHNVPLSVVTWMCECAEVIQSHPTMPNTVKGNGMTNARVFAESATALTLSKAYTAKDVVQQ
jgi:hypothetical protein